jgi:hypothetical protein
LYVRIKSSPLGAEYNRDSFVRTPIGVLRELMEHISSEEQRCANINSITQAHLAVLVITIAHGLSGSRRNPPKVKANEFLPFPDWRPNEEDKPQLDQFTRQTLTKLIKGRRIPMHVFVALLSLPED